MGRTNIPTAASLFKLSGTSYEYIAYIEDADKMVYIVSTSLTQVDLDRYADLLRTNILGSWVRKCKGSPATFAYSEPDLALSVPKVIVSSGMRMPGVERDRYSGVRKVDEENPQQEELVYILITQGRLGDVVSKIVIEPTLDRAAAHAMHEALNGYSTVFTAVMLKVNIGKLQDGSYSFKVVKDRGTLKTIDKEPTTKCIGFWC